MMFQLFFLFSISIALLTVLALKNKGPNQAEIKIALSFMSANFKGLLLNIKTLLSLLIKDLIQNPSKSNLIEIDPIIKNEKVNDYSETSTIDYLEEKESKEISDTNQYSSSEGYAFEDPVISEFSDEVVHLIEEEEEKAA